MQSIISSVSFQNIGDWSKKYTRPRYQHCINKINNSLPRIMVSHHLRPRYDHSIYFIKQIGHENKLNDQQRQNVYIFGELLPAGTAVRGRMIPVCWKGQFHGECFILNQRQQMRMWINWMHNQQRQIVNCRENFSLVLLVAYKALPWKNMLVFRGDISRQMFH